MGPLGWQETLFIFLLALLIFGPKKLPELGRNIGKAITEFRRASSELKATFDREMRSLEQENQSLQEVTRSYDYDYSNYDYNYDSTYYDSGSDSSNYDASGEADADQKAAAVASSTDSVSAPQGAESESGTIVAEATGPEPPSAPEASSPEAFDPAAIPKASETPAADS